MKTAHTLTALALAALLSTSASAQERRRDARDDDQRPNRQELLKRFDTNKDGQLDQKEREAARKALGQRGDKKRSGDDEKGTPPRQRGDRPLPAELLKRFDKNKDGKLDEAERVAARKALGQRGDKKKSGDDERGTPPRRRGDRPIPPEILKRFDKNKDGKLDETERAEARKVLAQRRGGDGDGERRRRGAGGEGDGEKRRGDGERPPQRRRRGEDGPPKDGPPKGGGDKGGDQ